MVQVVKTRQARDDNRDSSRPSPVWRLRSGHQIRGWGCFVLGYFEGWKDDAIDQYSDAGHGPVSATLGLYLRRSASFASKRSMSAGET
jgi:hypothetical protein